MNSRPAFQFYGGDWFRHPGLRTCTLAARGLAIDLLALMHDGDPYGHLAVAGTPMTDDMLARRVGEPVESVERLLAELLGFGVYARTKSGTIFSPRMMRDEKVRRMRAEGGKKSVEHPTVAARIQQRAYSKGILTEPYKGGDVASSGHVERYPSGHPLHLQSSSSASKEHTERASPNPTNAEPLRVPRVMEGPHRHHALCGRPCMHKQQHRDLVSKLGGDERAAEKRIGTWFVQVNTSYEGKPIPVADEFKFWNLEWDKAFGQPAVKPSEQRQNIKNVEQTSEMLAQWRAERAALA